jgi:hypothetical protein
VAALWIRKQPVIMTYSIVSDYLRSFGTDYKMFCENIFKVILPDQYCRDKEYGIRR